MKVEELATPALVAHADDVEANLVTMAAALPGDRLRPHVKAHKSTSIARLQRSQGHRRFTCATVREMLGMAAAGLGDDLLLANETIDLDRLAKLAALARTGEARVTVAADSVETLQAAAAAGVPSVLIDVEVGLPRCGCAPEEAGRLADLARRLGLEVRGVMGYEGHAVGIADRSRRVAECSKAMELLQAAHREVGGEIVSAGGTGTYDVNRFATEIQAGSYVLMDTAYATLNLPFRNALYLLATVISVSAKGWAVCDAGLKSLGMDHGNPSIDGMEVWFCSDEHVTFAPIGDSNTPMPKVGDRVEVVPAHIDPTVAYHEMIHVIDADGNVIDAWPVDLRGW